MKVKGQILNFYNFSDETKRMSIASSKFMIKTISYTTCPKHQKKRQVMNIANLTALLKNCPESPLVIEWHHDTKATTAQVLYLSCED